MSKKKPLKGTQIRYCRDCGHIEFRCPSCRQWHSIERTKPNVGGLQLVGTEGILVTLFGGQNCSVTIPYEEIQKAEKKLGIKIIKRGEIH